MTTIRVEPSTTTVHLDFNAGEDVDIEFQVLDADDAPVVVDSAVAVISDYAGVELHRWSADDANLTVPDVGLVRVSTTRAETAAWYAAWGDAVWQLEVVDTLGQQKRVCEGDVRVRQSRRSA